MSDRAGGGGGRRLRADADEPRAAPGIRV